MKEHSLWLSIRAGLGAMLAAAICLAGCSHHVECVDSVTFSQGDFPPNVAVDANHAYYCKGDELRVVDTSPKLKEPALVSSLTLPEKGMVRAVCGNNVFVTASYPSGLFIVDTSDTAAPRIVGRFAPFACDAAAGTGNLLLAVYAGKLSILDVSTPSAPAQLGTFDLPNRPYDIAVILDKVLCPCDFNGLVIVDVSNPANPVRADRYEDKTCWRGVDAPGPLVFGASGSMGTGRFQIGDMRNPSNPVLLGMLNIDSAAFDVAGSGTLAYLAMGNAGMDVIDISDPRSPRVCGSYRGWKLAATRVAVSGPFVFLWNDSNAEKLDIVRFAPGINKRVVAVVLVIGAALAALAAAAWKWRSAIQIAVEHLRARYPKLRRPNGVVPSSILAGIGETIVAEGLFFAAFASLLYILAQLGTLPSFSRPQYFWLPAATLPLVLCVRNGFRRKYRRAAGDVLGFLFSIPALLYLLLIMVFSIWGVP